MTSFTDMYKKIKWCLFPHLPSHSETVGRLSRLSYVYSCDRVYKQLEML